MHRTEIELREIARARRIALLHRRLADGIDLATDAKQALWHLRPGQVRGSRRLLDEVVKVAESCVQLIAARATGLAGTALGTMWIAGRRSQLRGEMSPASDPIAALVFATAAFAASVRRGIGEANELGDPGTAAVLSEVALRLDRLVGAQVGTAGSAA